MLQIFQALFFYELLSLTPVAMFPHFKSLILSHQKAPLAVRELFALDAAAVRSLLRYLGNFPDMTDILILSTCNRTEVYYCSPIDQTATILQGLFEQKQVPE